MHAGDEVRQGASGSMIVRPVIPAVGAEAATAASISGGTRANVAPALTATYSA
jgi:hypothetical protein